ncbi:hypothetical protein OSH11_03435 [Kaistia dalseonensis]|uniref:Uncharacterized protein n=1 Tax=Kaistia dalseonensis TaxID=410840 RepID=A0ABU0H3E3_9HYPH|nr:hypothetical protein [Kaistia dalseonensis]MCX5493751.1 hypothetical protein [Kaistia dalseonensis]MDQ0436315.1 hypothetical protein [Kaistia dalseonensis]
MWALVITTYIFAVTPGGPVGTDQLQIASTNITTIEGFATQEACGRAGVSMTNPTGRVRYLNVERSGQCIFKGEPRKPLDQ